MQTFTKYFIVTVTAVNIALSVLAWVVYDIDNSSYVESIQNRNTITMYQRNGNGITYDFEGTDCRVVPKSFTSSDGSFGDLQNAFSGNTEIKN